MSLKNKVLEYNRQKKGNPVSVYMGDAHKGVPKKYPKKPDIDDPDTPHELDDPHVVSALEDKHVSIEEGLAPPEPKTPEDPLPLTKGRPRITQFTVNCVRLRAFRVRISNAYRDLGKGMSDAKCRRKYGVVHLWFPEPHADHYSLRDGNPPADCERPDYLKYMKLHIDIWNPYELLDFANSLRIEHSPRITKAGLIVPRGL